MNKFGNNTGDIMAIFDKANKLRQEQEQIKTVDTETKMEEVSIEETNILDTDSDSISEESSEVGFVTLTGIEVSPTGEISKTKYFDMISVDSSKYNDITFSPEEAKSISMSLRRMSTGINAAIPMNCTGNQCPFARTCPYVEINKAPLGRPCLVESQLVEYWTKQFIEEFEVDLANITELHLVSELAEFNIYEKRITQYLADRHPTLMQDVISGVDPAGNIIENQEISRAFDLKERIKRNRMKVLESLMATRKERVKLKLETNQGNSTAEKMSDLKRKLQSVQEDIAKMQPIEGKIVDG